MKRIISVLFFVINTLLFFGIMTVYENKDSNYVYQIETEQSGVFHEWIALDNSNREIDSQSMFELFKELTERYELLISVSLGDFSRNQFDFYMASHTKIDQRLGLVTDVSIDFNESDAYFYTSRKDNPEGIYFYLLNTDLDVNIYPITYLGEMPSTMISFVANSQKELDESIAILLNHFGDYLTRIGEPTAEPYVVQDEINTFLPTTIIMSMICAFLLLMMYVHAESKKIAIFKTMGMSLLVTAFKMFFSLFVIIALVILITNSLLFAIFVGTVNARTIPMIIDLVKSGTYQLIGTFFTIVLSCLLLTFIPSYSLLKNSRLNHQLMKVNYVLKILVLITLLPLRTDKINNIMQEFAVIQYATNREIDGFQFVPRYKTEYENDGYDLFKYWEEFSQSRDIDIVNHDDLLYEYHQAYQILNEAGAIFCKSYELYGNDSGIMVNENYIKKHPIKDIDGNWIDIDRIDADVIYLIPEFYFEYHTGEFYLSDPFDNANYEMIVIDNKQEIFNYSPFWEYEFIQRPLMITLYKDTAFRLDASIFRDVYIDTDIKELLKSTPFNDKIVISSLGEEFAYQRERMIKNILDEVRFVLPTLALILVITIQYAYLYLKEFSQRIFIRKLLGHNPFRIYGGLVLESGFAVIVAAFITLLRKNDIRLFVFLMGVEVLVYLLIVLFLRNIPIKVSDANES